MSCGVGEMISRPASEARLASGTRRFCSVSLFPIYEPRLSMKGQIMTQHMPNSSHAADKMKTVKAAWDKAPTGPKKDAALKHYQAAEKAHTAKNDDEAVRELDKATKALS